MERPLVTIGTPFYNSQWAIERYEKGILDLDYPRDRIRILWVDNESTDHTLDRLKEFGSDYRGEYDDITIINRYRVEEKDTRLAFKKNIENVFNDLISSSDPRTDLVIIGSDCIPPSDGLKKLLKMRELGGNIVAGLTIVCSGKQGDIFLAPHFSCYFWNQKVSKFNSIPIAATKNQYYMKIVPRFQDKIIRCHGIGTGFSMIDREVFNHVRFQADIKFGEDLLFCLEAGLCGYKIFCDTSLFYDHIHYDYQYKKDKKGFHLVYRGSLRGEKTYIKR